MVKAQGIPISGSSSSNGITNLLHERQRVYTRLWHGEWIGLLGFGQGSWPFTHSRPVSQHDDLVGPNSVGRDVLTGQQPP
mgnify:CR=1 FL=1